MLIEHNADIQSRTELESPLHVAASPLLINDNQVDIMQVLEHGAGTRLLLKHGATIDVEDDNSRTPLQLALEYGRDDIATCLTEHGATR